MSLLVPTRAWARVRARALVMRASLHCTHRSWVSTGTWCGRRRSSKHRGEEASVACHRCASSCSVPVRATRLLTPEQERQISALLPATTCPALLRGQRLSVGMKVGMREVVDLRVVICVQV